MILRITVRDNDFTEDLEKFAEEIMLYPSIKKYVSELSTDKALEFLNRLDRFRELFYNTEKYTPELANELCSMVRENFELWVTYCMPNHEWWSNEEAKRTKEMLINDFQVKFQKSLTPKWENGEVVYICCGYYNRWWTF